MAKFLYTARHAQTGETKGGKMEAQDERALASLLRADGFLLTSAEEEKEKKKFTIRFLSRFGKVSLKDRLMFARSLSVMISSGLPIVRAIRILVTQTKNKSFQKMLEKVSEDLQGGSSLADSMSRHPSAFDDLFVNMVRVGEIGGNLEEVLQIVATQIEKEHALISKVRGAMAYPSVIVVAMIGIGIVMLTYVLPKITGVFKDMEVTLPPTTQFIISMSDFAKNHSILTFGGFFGLIVFFYFFRKTTIGKKVIAFVILRLPVIGNMSRKVNCARFARIYSSLLKSGVSVTDTLGIVANTLTNYYYRNAILGCVAEIQKGIPLSKVLAKDAVLFPTLLFQIVEVGEETGKTEEVLLKLAEFYEDEVDQVTKNLSSIIEPVLMVVIGGGVGFFAVAMLQPMYGAMENIK